MQVLVAELPTDRCTLHTEARVGEESVPCMVLSMPGPGSYTGEDVVELHLPGSPLLLDQVGRELSPTARPATPGEFTRRAFVNGRNRSPVRRAPRPWSS